MNLEHTVRKTEAIRRTMVLAMLVAWASGCDAPFQMEEVGLGSVATSQQALTDTEAEDTDTEARLGFTLLDDAHLHETALWASDSMRIANGVQVLAPSGGAADVVSIGSGRVELETDVIAEGDIISRGPVKLADRCAIYGTVKSGEAVEQGNDVAVEDGIVAPAALEDGPTYEWTVSFPSPESDLRVEPDRSATLLPGSYGSVAVQPRATLTLVPGTYYFDAFTAESTAVLNLESDGEPIFVYVKTALTCRAQIAKAQAANFFVGFIGEGKADLDGPFYGTVVAPNATIRLAPLNSGSHAGSFFGKRIEVEAWTPVELVPFDHWDFIFPPVLTLACVSRAAKQNAAALFSYDNPLDIAVTIDDEERNFATADTLRSEPLQRFEAGAHAKAVWISFIGDTLSWTLDGTTVAVNLQTRGCTLDDYLVESDAPYVPTRPKILSTASGGTPETNALMAGYYVGSNTTLSFEEYVSANETYAPPLTAEGTSMATVNLRQFKVGDDGFGTMDLDLNLCIGEDRYSKNLFDGGWLAQGVVIADVTYTASVPEDGDDFIVTVYLIERDVFDDDEVLTMITQVDKQTGFILSEVLVDDDGKERSVKFDLNSTMSCASLDGWGFCYDVFYVQSKAKLCAEWKTQFRDSGVGETFYNSTSLQTMPASFAEAKLSITGGNVPFEAWTDFFPLDKDGCVPEAYAPNTDQFIGNGTDPVQVDLAVKGRLRGSWTAPTPGKTEWKVVNNEQLFVIEQTTDIGQNTGGDITIELNALNEYTKAAAIAGFVLKRQAEGADMGVSEQALSIEATANATDANGAKGRVELRPNSDTVPFGDASDKFVVGHEIGHNIEHLGSGWLDTGKNYYNFPDDVPYPPATPDECKCFVQTGLYSPLHCAQSIEMPNPAQMEGFAHFYATKLWSDPAQDSGWMGYPKWTYAPTCPPGVDCEDILSVSAETRAQMTGFPDNPIPGWKLVKAPYPIPMKDTADYVNWRKWRNSHCVDPINGTPDMSSFGVEMDWMRFYFALNTEGGDGQWLMQDIFDLVRAVATDDDGTGPDVAHSGEMRWEYLEEEAFASFSQEKQFHFTRNGNEQGVDMNTAP